MHLQRIIRSTLECTRVRPTVINCPNAYRGALCLEYIAIHYHRITQDLLEQFILEYTCNALSEVYWSISECTSL